MKNEKFSHYFTIQQPYTLLYNISSKSKDILGGLFPSFILLI